MEYNAVFRLEKSHEFSVGHKVFPFWQEVANNLGGAMTGVDHPDNTQTDCVWLFYTAFSTSGLSTSPIYSKGARVKCSLIIVMESGNQNLNREMG